MLVSSPGCRGQSHPQRRPALRGLNCTSRGKGRRHPTPAPFFAKPKRAPNLGFSRREKARLVPARIVLPRYTRARYLRRHKIVPACGTRLLLNEANIVLELQEGFVIVSRLYRTTSAAEIANPANTAKTQPHRDQRTDLSPAPANIRPKLVKEIAISRNMRSPNPAQKPYSCQQYAVALSMAIQ